MTNKFSDEEILEMLNQWACEKELLRPGERVVVVRDNILPSEKVVDARRMNIYDFFSADRFEKAGYPKRIASRAVKAIIHLTRYGSFERDKIERFTIQELSEWQPFRRALSTLQWKNVGVKTQDAIKKVLVDAGIEV